MKKLGNWLTRLYFYVEQPLRVQAIRRTFFASAEGFPCLQIGFHLELGWVTSTLTIELPCLTLTAGWDYLLRPDDECSRLGDE